MRRRPLMITIAGGLAIGLLLIGDTFFGRKSICVPPPQPIPFMGNYNCTQQLCTEFLTGSDIQRTNCGVHKFSGKCHFMNGNNRPGVYLVSSEGSGNTWVRGLLEQATGICTGAVYCDEALKRGGFNGESLTSGVVLVTKSHKRYWLPQTKAAILLVRNPLDTYIAEWNRRNTKRHTGVVDEKLFGKEVKWNQFIRRNPWTDYFKWLVTGLQTGRQVLVVRYEDLKSDRLTQVKRMLEFLGVPYSDEALWRRMSNDFDTFHRPHNNDTSFNHYTPEQRQYIKGQVKEVVEYLKSNNNGTTYGIEEYL